MQTCKRCGASIGDLEAPGVHVLYLAYIHRSGGEVAETREYVESLKAYCSDQCYQTRKSAAGQGRRQKGARA